MSVGAQHGVEGVDAVAEELDPAVVDVVRRARALAAPEVVLGGLVHDLALRRDDEQRVEVAVRHHLGPARLALDDEVRLVVPRERAPAARVSSPGMSMKRSCAATTCGMSKASSVKPVSAPSASAISLHRHVDADDRHRRVDAVLDRVEVPPMCLRSPTPWTTVERPTARYGATACARASTRCRPRRGWRGPPVRRPTRSPPLSARRPPQMNRCPPSTLTVCPVMKDAAGLGEVGDALGDVLGQPSPRHRLLGHDLVEERQLVGIVEHAGRLDEARRDGVDGDSMRARPRAPAPA